MDKQSGSDDKTDFVSSPAVEKMKKQRATASNIDEDEPTKQIQSHQTQNLDTPTINPLSQITDQFDQINPLASCYDDSDQLTQILKIADQNQDQIPSIDYMKTEIAETNAQIAQANLTIGTLKSRLTKVQRDNEALSKVIDARDKIRNELIEKQNISEHRGAVYRDQTVALKDTLTSVSAGKDQLKLMYENVLLKANEKIKNLKKELDGPLVPSKEDKDLADQLMLKEIEISQAKIIRQQRGNQAVQDAQKFNERSCRLKELEKIREENKQKHDTEMKRLSRIAENVKLNLNREREEIAVLSVRNNESLERFKDLSIKYQTLQDQSMKNAKRVQDSKSSIQEVKEKRKHLMREIEDLKRTNLTIISERDLEFDDYRNQLRDLTFQHTETTNKLVQLTSDNEKLSDTIAKRVERNEELKKASLSKNDELKNLKDNLIDAKLKGEKLSAETRSLNEKLNAQKKLVSQTKADLETVNTEEDEESKRETEMETRLAVVKQKLKKKIADKANLRKKLSTAKSRSLEERQKFEEEIEQKDKILKELKKTRENRQRESERIELENSRKLQEATNLSMQCQRAEHEKQIRDQKMKLDIIKQEIAAENLQQENMNKQDSKRDEEREAQIKELEAETDHVTKIIAETEKQQKALRATIFEFKSVQRAQSSISLLESRKSSPLLGTIYGKNQSKAVSSTPEQSPQDENFVIDSFSDISSIGDGADIFQEAERRFAQYLENNETDTAKLSKPNKADKSDDKKPR